MHNLRLANKFTVTTRCIQVQPKRFDPTFCSPKNMSRLVCDLSEKMTSLSSQTCLFVHPWWGKKKECGRLHAWSNMLPAAAASLSVTWRLFQTAPAGALPIRPGRNDLPIPLRTSRDFMSRWSFCLSPRSFYSYFSDRKKENTITIQWNISH